MGVRDWFRRRPSDQDMQAELESHLAMRAEYDATDEAAARKRLGNVLLTKEEMRSVWRAPFWDSVSQDARFTWRTWRRNPGFTVAALTALALGLGAATGLFSMVDRILFRSLPYPDADRIVSVGLMAPLDANEFMLGTDYMQLWRDTPAPFESVTTVTAGTTACDLTEISPVRLTCAPVEANLLRALRMQVVAGRDFRPEDDTPGAPRVALISHGLWLNRFGGDPAVQGRRIFLDGQAVEIAGVLPLGFELPTLAAADVLLPQQLAPHVPGRPTPTAFLRAFARLRPGIAPSEAHAALQPLYTAMLKNVPAAFRKEVTLRVRPLRDRQVGEARQAAWFLLAAVAALLLIACTNVANLLLARMAARERELAVRSSLGADRGRLVRLVLTESLLLALMGGALGLFIAYAFLKIFVAAAPAGIPKLAQASVDLRVVLAALGLAVIAALLIGVSPAFSLRRTGSLHGSRTTTGVRPWTRLALVATQIGLTFSLLGSSTLLLRSLWNLQRTSMGFDSSKVIAASITLHPGKYRVSEQQLAFFDQLLDGTRRMPGVVLAALSDSLPPIGQARSMIFSNIEVEGRPLPSEGTGGMVTWRSVTAGYFEALRIPILRGRSFTEEDRHASEPAVIVSERLNRKLFGSEIALGKRIRFGRGEQPWHIVVGIARDIRNAGLAVEPEPEYYVAQRMMPRDANRRGFVVVRTQADPAISSSYLRAEIAELDPELPVTIQTMDERVAELAARPRFTAWLLIAFAGVALILACTGLSGVATYLVTQRTRDIGVRMALGATPANVSGAVLQEAARWAGAGALMGILLSWTTSKLLASFLHGVTPSDPMTWGIVMFLLSATLGIAVLRPALRAARVDPMNALRCD